MSDVAPNQDRMANPYGMDPACSRCPELAESRDQLLHGYGDVTADFLVVRRSPTAAAEAVGHPIPEGQGTRSLRTILDRCGFIVEATDAHGNPILENVFVTHLTRCRNPSRGPTEQEIDNCEPFLNAELRTINPEIILPIGEVVLRTIAAAHTTTDPETLDIEEVHADELRGRGFELIPLLDPEEMPRDTFDRTIDRIRATLERDYRQTKGRRER